MLGHRGVRASLVVLGVGRAQRGGLVQRHPRRHVSAQRIVRARLIGDDVGSPAASQELGLHVGAVAQQPDRHGLPARSRLVRPAERGVQVVGLAVEVPRLDPALDPRGVDIDAERDAAVHGDRQRLCPAHPAEAAGQRDRPLERPAEALMGTLRERLVRPLQDPLRPDVDPRARRHLPVHRETRGLELAERVPIRPLGNEHRVRDQHARRHRVRPEHPDGLARLHQERLLVAERLQRPHDRVVRLPRPRGPPGPAVDDQVLGALGHVGVEVVHEHPHRGFLRPRTA